MGSQTIRTTEAENTMRALRIPLLVTFLSSTATAQVLQPRQPRALDQWLFGISGFGGVPVGEFRDHENGGGGGELMLGFQPWRRQPLIVRAQAGVLVYGSIDAEGYQDVCDFFGCYQERVTYNARNHTMTFLQIGPEIMATDGLWRPFAFAMLGRTFFNSRANFQPADPNDPDPGSASLFSSNNFSTTYGAGIRRVGTRFGREMGFEFSSRVIRNAKASYLNEDGLIIHPDGTWETRPRHGAANVLGIHVGFWMGPYINWNERR